MTLTPSGRRRVPWLWATLSGVLQFAGIYLTNYNPTPYRTAVVETVGAGCLLVGLVGYLTYVRRYGLPPSVPADE